MTSRSRAGTTTWPLGEVLTIGMAILPWFNYIIICTTFLLKLNNNTYQCNDESLTPCENGRPASPMNVTRLQGAYVAQRAGVIERPLGAGEDFTRLLSYVSWRIFDFRFLFGIHSASSDGSSDHVEAPFTHVW